MCSEVSEKETYCPDELLQVAPRAAVELCTLRSDVGRRVRRIAALCAPVHQLIGGKVAAVARTRQWLGILTVLHDAHLL
jgi:hypothetical protein